ncbi:putative chloride channel protein, partial [Termitomyces sp. T112]
QHSRYEDFTTIDWIQDSILERNRRIRTAHSYSAPARVRRGPGRSWFWLWSQVRKAMDMGQSWFVVSLAGMVIGVNAAIISIITQWLSDIKFGYCSDGWWLNQQFCCWEIEGEDVDGCDSWHPWSNVMMGRWTVFVFFATLFSFVAAHLVRSMAKYAAGSGISEIKCILAGFVMQGYLGFATVVIKSITLPLVIASGLSVGKEGPSVHVACCIGSLVAGLFKKFSRSQGKMREIVTAASAAGVAVAFGSPIGGVLFSIEEMSHGFSIKTMWRSFLCALVATVTLSAMNPFRTGKLVLFQITYDRDWHFFEIMFYVILGIFGGLYGAFMVKFNLQVAAFRRKHLANHGVAEAVTLATLTAMIGYFNRFLRMDMTSSMAILFRECEGGGNIGNLCQTPAQWRISNSLFLATIIRIGLVVISYGCKVPAGIFVPSMAIGATFGRMIGILVKAMERAYTGHGIFAVCAPDVPCITPGTYAFLGAAAALSGVMRITVTVVVIMFELTGALNYILPTMIVLLVTKAVGDFLGTNGIADEMIRFNGFPFLEKEDHAYNVSVSAVMRTGMHTLMESGMDVKQIEDILEATHVKGFPIESADGLRHIIGYIGRTELRYVLDRAKKMPRVDDDTRCHFAPHDSEHSIHSVSFGIEEEAAGTSFFESALSEGGIRFWPWVNLTPITVSPGLPLEIVMQLFKRMGPRVILVENHGVLMGLVTVKDVLKFIATKPSHELSWDDRGGLDGLLEEVWTWTAENVHRAIFNLPVPRVSGRRHVHDVISRIQSLFCSTIAMAHSSNTSTPSSQQLYSSSLAAYTLKQFSAAQAALDSDEQATAKLPATVKMYGHHVSKRSTETPSQSASSECPSSLESTKAQ